MAANVALCIWLSPSSGRSPTGLEYQAHVARHRFGIVCIADHLDACDRTARASAAAADATLINRPCTALQVRSTRLLSGTPVFKVAVKKAKAGRYACTLVSTQALLNILS